MPCDAGINLLASMAVEYFRNCNALMLLIDIIASAFDRFLKSPARSSAT